MTLSEYTQLKQSIVYAAGQAERHSELLSSLKEIFRDGINSVRRFEQINSVGQLLQVLEIRDILSEDNVECLKNIALKLPNSKQLLKKITDYEDCHVPRECVNYYVGNKVSKGSAEQEESFITVNSNSVGRNISERKKQRIFKTIIEEIGSFWRDLGRNLRIRECDIDDIDLQNKTVAEKASKIMKAYEYHKADPDKWFFVLCDALEKARRKDLVRSIQDIMAMNI
ncbi:fas-associated death domain protein isoform X2 [Anticarsia gemmatalis]|uniref:fas-associated death domain protein isoform X2 n=1 Tax=Anticarsia gemmatalis TaxID=129554 RepID=UPI003F7588D4